MKQLVIDRPELQSPMQRAVYTSLTAAFWFVWIYIWLPFLNLLAWALGIKIWYTEMIVKQGWHSLVILSSIYAIVILIMGGMLISWGMYNWFRFAGKERRRYAPNVSVAAAAKHFRVDETQLSGWQESRRLTVHLNDDGRVTEVETSAVPVAAAVASAMLGESDKSPT